MTVLVNPTTKLPTCFEPIGDTPRIFSGSYQNVTEVSDEWVATERARIASLDPSREAL